MESFFNKRLISIIPQERKEPAWHMKAASILQQLPSCKPQSEMYRAPGRRELSRQTPIIARPVRALSVCARAAITSCAQQDRTTVDAQGVVIPSAPIASRVTVATHGTNTTEESAEVTLQIVHFSTVKFCCHLQWVENDAKKGTKYTGPSGKCHCQLQLQVGNQRRQWSLRTYDLHDQPDHAQRNKS